MPADLPEKFQGWLSIAADRILVAGILFAFFYSGFFLVRFGLLRLEPSILPYLMKNAKAPAERERRLKTLFSVKRTLIYVLYWFTAILVTLGTVGIEIGPILAAFGVLGIAVGLGAQTLIRDLLNGVLLLIEDQIRVGDVAAVNGQRGIVEIIDLRKVVLRDAQGVVHVYPNSQIRQLSNVTKLWSAAVFDLRVGLQEDPDLILDLLRELATRFREDEAFAPRLAGPVEVLGVEEMTRNGMVLRMRFRTKPGEQMAVIREFRRRLKKEFDARGIPFPLPMRKLFFRISEES